MEESGTSAELHLLIWGFVFAGPVKRTKRRGRVARWLARSSVLTAVMVFSLAGTAFSMTNAISITTPEGRSALAAYGTYRDALDQHCAEASDMNVDPATYLGHKAAYEEALKLLKEEAAKIGKKQPDGMCPAFDAQNPIGSSQLERAKGVAPRELPVVSRMNSSSVRNITAASLSKSSDNLVAFVAPERLKRIDCPATNSAVEKGLVGPAVQGYRCVHAAYPNLVLYGRGARATGGEHPIGKAVDAMIPSYKTTASKALGSEIAQMFIANASYYNVKYVIWQQQIWQPGKGWKKMENRGSDTENHLDHVHISFN